MKKLTRNEKDVLKTAVQCVAIYAATIAIINWLGKTETGPLED